MTEGKPDRVLEIADPCPAAWDEMSGTTAQRHCGGCGKTVHHLSAMAPAAAAALLAGEAPGGICVRVRCDRDGFVLHDAPTQQRTAHRRLRLLTPAVLAAMAACSAPGESDLALVVEGPGFIASSVQRESASARALSAQRSTLGPTASAAPDESRPPAHVSSATQARPVDSHWLEPNGMHVMGLMSAPIERPQLPPKPARRHSPTRDCTAPDCYGGGAGGGTSHLFPEQPL